MVSNKSRLRFDWIPPAERTSEQTEMAESYAARVGTFGAASGGDVVLPERMLFCEQEVKHLGNPLVRVWQQSGSCVGASAGRAYMRAMFGDVLVRKDDEEVKLDFPYATYGVGRKIAGMRGRGEGSFGAAQAQAVETFGLMPWDHPLVPKPQIENGWAKWTEKQELDWSHPNVWPERYEDISETANKYKIDTTQITSTDELDQALAQYYGVTMASMFGTRGPRVQGDVLLARWDGSWAHQMEVGGFWQHPQLGMLYEIDNQWGPSVHGTCPTLSQFATRGSFWIEQTTMAKIIRNGEVFAHTNTDGFPLRDIWGSIGL